MKFGHVSQEEIASVDFSLPPDHADSVIRRDSRKRAEHFEVYTGCGKWGIPKWVGSVYPEGTKQKDFLPAYLNTFNSIELNGTYYRLSRKSIEAWAEAAKDTPFRYCPKWSRRISHIKRLKEPEENITYFVDSCRMLGKNLGATFLTLPPNFAGKYIDRVKEFIEFIPNDFPTHLELRHEDWFKEPVFTEICEALEAKGIGLVITDVALRRDVLHQRLTTDEVFIRWNGYGPHKTDFQRLDAWVERLKSWQDQGLRRVYFFCHQADEAHTPPCCGYFLNAINKACGLEGEKVRG